MRGLRRLAWRSLRGRPLRTTLTIAGVALGVGLLFAGMATNAGIDAAADRAASALMGRADLRVAAFGETGLGRDTIEAIGTTPGVAIAAPALERRTYLESATTDAALPASVTVLGIVPEAEAGVRDLALVAGRPLSGIDEPAALITERLAAEEGLAIGSPLSILGAGDPGDYHVVGILAGDGPVDGVLGRTVVVPLRTAQAVFDQAGVTRVDVGLEPAADPDAVIEAFETRLLTEPYVVSTPAEIAASLRASTAEFSATTALIAAIALFVGAFLIFNTLSMTVIERVREVGLLRAAGATRRQVQSFILTQALIVGLIGSILGLGLGALLAAGMAAYLGTIGTVELGSTALPAGAAAVAVLVGLAVTLAAAIEPARRAARIPPVEALKARLTTSTSGGTRGRWLLVVLGLVALGVLLLWPGSAGSGSTTASLRSLAVYGVLLVVTLLIPLLLPGLARLGGLPFRLPLGLEERLARATLVRDRGRATLTVGALTVGLALIVSLGAVSQHARAAAAAWVSDVLPGDVLVTSVRPIAADEGVAADLAAVGGVARVSPIATFEMAVNGVATESAAMVGADLADDGRLNLTSGDRAAALAALDAGGSTILPQALAERLGVGVGDTVAVTSIDGATIPLTIAAIAERTLPGRGGEAVLVGWTDAIDDLGVVGADAFAVRYTTPPPTSVQADLTAAATLAALEVVPLDHVQGAIDDALDRVFGLFDALALVAVLVAALGIVNTLTMNVMERVREIGILRAAGMTRRQVWRSVVVEAGIVGVSGGVLGVVTGLLAGALMVLLAGGRLGVDSIPWTSIVVAVILGVVLAMLAAAWPARIAARISIPRAVAYE